MNGERSVMISTGKRVSGITGPTGLTGAAVRFPKMAEDT